MTISLIYVCGGFLCTLAEIEKEKYTLASHSHLARMISNLFILT